MAEPYVPRLGELVYVLEVCTGRSSLRAFRGQLMLLDDPDWPPLRASSDHGWLPVPQGGRYDDWVIVTTRELDYKFGAKVRPATPEEEAAYRLGG